jgi:transcriptional regulator with XRE-family HTH domain
LRKVFDDMEFRHPYPLQILEGGGENPPGRLGQRRKELGLGSQADLADLLGVSMRALQNWEAGKHLPRGKMLQRYAHLLDMPIGDLMELDPEPSQLDRIEAQLEEILSLLTGQDRDAVRQRLQQGVEDRAQQAGKRAHRSEEGSDGHRRKAH